MLDYHLREAFDLITAQHPELACDALRCALSLANHERPQARSAIMRALNYARRIELHSYRHGADASVSAIDRAEKRGQSAGFAEGEETRVVTLGCFTLRAAG